VVIEATLTTVTTPRRRGPASTPSARRLLIAFAPGPVASRLVQLGAAPVVVGREPGSGVTLADSEVSRQHARIEVDAGGVHHIVDLDSRNGVFVDGLRAKRAPLRDGSVIRIGACVLLYLEHALPASAPRHPPRPGLLGESVGMQRVRGEVALVAPHTTNVLILGDTGVGKEAIAGEIHRLSGRPGRYIAVNCAAIPEHLAESELFGHVAGAFTGAGHASDGLFLSANHGTLFLDEIGELSPALEPKLLRALASGEIRPVGSTRTVTVDVRIVAATHQPLRAQVTDGTFRGDLYARLSAWTIEVLPLRERREDILSMAQSWLSRGSELSADSAEALLLHGWPFNVRELKNTVEAAAVRAGKDGVVGPEHLPDPIAARVRRDDEPSPTPTPATPGELLVDRSATPDRDTLLRLLQHFAGSVPQVAQFLGRHRRQVYRWLDRHQIALGTGADATSSGDADRDPVADD
jgi:transcriptional regulator with GAF, ATPase, and Fis domain